MHAFVYKLRATQTQARLMDETLETCRWLYNQTLADRKTAWEERQATRSFESQCRWHDPQDQHPHLTHVHTLVLQGVLKRVERAFDHCFRRVRWYDSFTYKQASRDRWVWNETRELHRLQPWECQTRMVLLPNSNPGHTGSHIFPRGGGHVSARR